MTYDDPMEVNFDLRLLTRSQTASCHSHNCPGVSKARELRHLYCQRITLNNVSTKWLKRAPAFPLGP